MVNPQGISQEKLPMRSEATVAAVLQASPGFTTEEINHFSLQAQGSGNTNSFGNHGYFRFVTGEITFSDLQAQGSGNTNSLGNTSPSGSSQERLLSSASKPTGSPHIATKTGNSRTDPATTLRWKRWSDCARSSKWRATR